MINGIARFMHVPEHGEFDSETKQWFCGYWMSKQVWMDVHHYSPPSAEEIMEEETNESA